MKVFVIYDKETWEIIGIDRIFADKNKAVEYLEQFRESIERKGRSFEVFCLDEIHEVEVS